MINMGIRNIVVFFAEFVRYDDQTDMIIFMKNWIFLLLFLQLGVMMTLASINAREV
jgi:hypothetical protein